MEVLKFQQSIDTNGEGPAFSRLETSARGATMQERELRAHVAALLIAARHVVVAYRKASVREQDEAIDRLRRIVSNVERQIATSSEPFCAPDEGAPRPVGQEAPVKNEVTYFGGRRIQVGRERPAKSRTESR